MTTTLNVRLNGQVELPEDFCRRKKIKPGTVLRVTEVGGGLFVTPLAEPTESELKAVISAAGSLTRTQTPRGRRPAPGGHRRVAQRAAAESRLRRNRMKLTGR